MYTKTALLSWFLVAMAAAQPTSQPTDAAARPVAFTPRDFGLRFEYQSRYWFDRGSDQGESFAALEQELTARIPLLSNEVPFRDGLQRSQQLQLTGGLRSLDLDTNVRIPRSRGPLKLGSRRLPTHLWEPSIGLQYRTEAKGHRLGVDATLSSPSDRPFSSGEEVSIRVNAFYRMPRSETTAWWFFVSLANAREFAPLIPLPGFGYQWQPNDELDLLAGFPFSRFRYQATPWLTFHGRYIFPRQVFTEAVVQADDWQVYTGYEWTRDTFFLHDRRNDDDRLFAFEQRVKLGLRSPKFLDGAGSLELEGGYAFDRIWFEGEDFDDRFDSRINLSDGPYVRLMLRIEL